MYILKLSLQKLFSRPGSTLFSVLLFAIGCSIISLIVLAGKNFQHNVERNFAGIDLVVGAKGSPTQLILSSVLHADYPTGNINLREAENLARSPHVRQAIPIALGDNFRGFRIVGAPVAYARLYNVTLDQGQWYEHTLEAVIGANVARSTGVGIGDTFYGVHGFQQTGHAHPEFVYTITGVMNRVGGIMDNLILTPVASVWKVHEGHHHHDHDHDHADHHHDHEACCEHDHDQNHHHAEDHREHTHDHKHHDHHASDHAHPDQKEPLHIAEIRTRMEAGEDLSFEEMQLFQNFMMERESMVEGADREITAMLLQFRSPAGIIQLTRLINESTNMQAAVPALEMNRLMNLLSIGFDVLMLLAWVIIIISGINIFIHLCNTLRQGVRDIALMRIMGASRIRVFMLLVFQGALLAMAGWLLGVVLSRIIWLVLPSFDFIAVTGFVSIHPQEWFLLLYAILTGVAASLIPAWNAYNTDVHYTLTQK